MVCSNQITKKQILTVSGLKFLIRLTKSIRPMSDAIILLNIGCSAITVKSIFFALRTLSTDAPGLDLI